MATENYDPYDQAYWGKGKGKKGKKGKSKFQYPYDGNKGYPSYENGKGKGGHDKGKPKTFAAIAEKSEEHPATQPVAELQEPAYAGWTVGINHGHGTNKAGTHPMRHPAQDKR